MRHKIRETCSQDNKADCLALLVGVTDKPVGVQKYDKTKSRKKRQIAGDIRYITCYYKIYRLPFYYLLFYLPVAVARLFRQSEHRRLCLRVIIIIIFLFLSLLLLQEIFLL